MPNEIYEDDEVEVFEEDDGLDGLESIVSTANGRLDGPLLHNNGLVAGGEPAPQAIWKNLRNYGYASPRLEYVQSMKAVSVQNLARKWNIATRTLLEWRKDENWPAQRERFWNAVNTKRERLLAKDIADMQVSEVTERLGMWSALRNALESIASQGYIEEVTQKGGLVKRNYSPKDLKDMAAVMEKIDDGIGLAIGLTKEVLRKDSDSADVTIKSTQEITYRVREAVPEIPVLTPIKLPELEEIKSPPEYTVEAEVENTQ